MYNILTSHDANGIHRGVKTNGSEQYSKDFCSIHNERNSKKRQPSMKTVYKYAKLHDDGNDSFIPKPSKSNLKKTPRGIKTRRVSPLEDPVAYPIDYGFDRKPEPSRYNYYNCLSPYSRRIIVTIPEVDCESEHSINNEGSRVSLDIPIESRSPVCRSGYVQTSHINSKLNINLQPAKKKQEVVGKQSLFNCKSRSSCREETSIKKLSKPPNQLACKQNICTRFNIDDKNVKTESKFRTCFENERVGSPVRRASKKAVPDNNDRVNSPLLTGNLSKNNNNDLGTSSIKLDDIEKEFDKISARTKIMQKKLPYKRPSSFDKSCTSFCDGRTIQKPDRKPVNLPEKHICPIQTQPKVNSFLVRKTNQNVKTLNSKQEYVEQQISSPNKSRSFNSKEMIGMQDNVMTVMGEQQNQQFRDVITKPPTRPRSPKKIETKRRLREKRNFKIESKASQHTAVSKFTDDNARHVSDHGSKKLTVKSEMALKAGLNSNNSSLTSSSPKKLNNNCKSADNSNILLAISSPEATKRLTLPVPSSCNIIENLCHVNKDECTEKPIHSIAKDGGGRDEDEMSLISSKSLPHLKVPDTTLFEKKRHSHLNNTHNKSEYIMDKSKAVYISETYVSFTQEKQINIKVLDSKQSTDEKNSGAIGSIGPYPFSVMSVIQREMRTSHSKSCCNTENESVINQESFYNSRIQNIFKAGNMNVDLAAYSKALIKPSDIIKEIKKSKKICFDVNALSTQFTRELNFLDSFIESIQYLKNTEDNNALLAEIKNKHSLFTHSVPSLQQAINCEPKFSKSCDLKNMTIAETDFDITKSICLLNLLIRDEHRRAKKLLFVLKMRENALKDFTKSQILWLQSKKKMLDTDVTILKKKQRGALLKLHQECGEMDRMRKILMTISERRQATLMQTKKNIELKLRAGCEVESLWKSRKKIKNNIQRSRSFSPMKCFEMSGNSYLTDDGTDKDILNFEKLSIAATSYENIFEGPPKIREHSKFSEPKLEKSVQTGNSIIEIVQRTNALPPCKDHTVVDGGYLNILLHNLALPQMFSSGKEYEVNTDALRGVLNSVNMVQNSSARVINVSGNKPVVIMNEKNGSTSTSPSTARSLVDEFDKLFEGYSYDKTETQQNIEQKSDNPVVLTIDIDASDIREESAEENEICHSPSVTDTNLPSSSPSELVPLVYTAKQNDAEDYFEEREICIILPKQDKVETKVNTVESEIPKSDESMELKLHSCQAFSSTSSSQNSQESPRESGPVSVETHIQHLCQPLSSISEELRRKELAIELEIKALQQAQLNYCIREIPNKPPPPYTPPTQDVSEAAPLQISTATNSVQSDFEYDPAKLAHRISEICDHLFMEKVSGALRPPKNTTFDVYLYDLCKEKITKLSRHTRDEPWDACNIVPQKLPPTKEEFKIQIINEIFEMMNSNIDRDSYGYSHLNYYQHKRPVNHIDDILLSDWRKCENEWTSLENDEVDVKNQVVKSVITSLISESLADYANMFT